LCCKKEALFTFATITKLKRLKLTIALVRATQIDLFDLRYFLSFASNRSLSSSHSRRRATAIRERQERRCRRLGAHGREGAGGCGAVEGGRREVKVKAAAFSKKLENHGIMAHAPTTILKTT
jgi:hypothetical protein